MNALLKRLWTDEDGASLVEYVLILALVVLVTVGALQTLSTSESNHFTEKGNVLNPAGK